MKKTYRICEHIQPGIRMYSLLVLGILSLALSFCTPSSAVLPIANTVNSPAVIAETATHTATATVTPRPTATFTATPVPLTAERSQLRYSEEVTNLEVLFASHIVANQPKTADEYRVIFIGDSATWARYMPSKETLAGRLNKANLQTCDSRTVRVYNMSLGSTSLVKDLVLIEKAVEYQPDLVIWFLTLNTFRPESQLSGRSFIRDNRVYIQDLSERYKLGLNTSGLVENAQTPEQAWEIVRNETEPPHRDSYPLLENDQGSSIQFTKMLRPPKIQAKDLPFNLFYSSLRILSRTKVLMVNEPIFISTGKNSNLRYNQYYPRWVYDQFRTILLNQSQAHGWDYLDLWNYIPSDKFTGTPLHRTPSGELLMFRKVAPNIKGYPCR